MATSHDAEESHDAPQPITEEVHDNSWSANLEKPQHADDRDLVVAQAIEAVEHTTSGNHVNLVTHGDQGHPSKYLFEAVQGAVDADLTVSYVDQCGCGGHVTRVHVE
ncbi:MAG: CGCGG family rSAM-modified RiPP protein [Haloarculaceae archaeon]